MDKINKTTNKITKDISSILLIVCFTTLFIFLFSLNFQVTIAAEDNSTNTTNTTNLTNTTNTTTNTTNSTNITYDYDGDGFNATLYGGLDCDDNNSQVNPNATELFNNLIDDDCNNNTKDELKLIITTSKEQYAIGEDAEYTIVGTPNSNLSISMQTPTDYYFYQLEYANATYPVIEDIPQTSKSGIYTIHANLSYFETKTNLTHKTIIQKDFEVVNSIIVDITSPTSILLNETAIFSLVGIGGFGQMNYIWDFGDGSPTTTGTQTSHKYNLPDEYTVRITAVDEKNNSKQFTRNIEIIPIYTLKFKIQDKDTNQNIDLAQVIAEDLIKNTNAQGEIDFNLPRGTVDFTISKEGFFPQSGDFNLRENTTLNLTLKLKDETAPIITLNSNDISIENEQAIIKYAINDLSNTNCSFFISEDGNWWTLKDTKSNITSTEAIEVILTNLTLTNYFYKIECSDSNGNSAFSEEGNISGADRMEQLLIENAKTEYKNLDEAITNALSGYDQMTLNQREVMDALNSKTYIKELQRFVVNFGRDVDSIYNAICPGTYCKISEEEKQNHVNNLRQRIENLTSKSAVSVNIISTEDYVKYPTIEEVEEIIIAYYGAKKIVKKQSEIEKLAKETLKLQSKLLIKTKAILVKVTYLNLDTQTSVIVIKELEADESISKLKVIEYLKDSNEKDININVENTKLSSELLELTVDNYPKKIVYQLNDDISPKNTQSYTTIVFDPTLKSNKLPSGFAILENISVSNMLIYAFIAILIIVLILRLVVAVVPNANPFEHIHLFNSTKTHVKKLNMLVEDATQYLEDRDFEKASLVYKEIKLTYSSEEREVREQVYQDIVELVKKLDKQHLTTLVKKCSESVNNADFKKTQKIYSEINEIYKHLDKSSKEDMIEIIIELSKKINNRSNNA